MQSKWRHHLIGEIIMADKKVCKWCGKEFDPAKSSAGLPLQNTALQNAKKKPKSNIFVLLKPRARLVPCPIFTSVNIHFKHKITDKNHEFF